MKTNVTGNISSLFQRHHRLFYFILLEIVGWLYGFWPVQKTGTYCIRDVRDMGETPSK